MQLVPSSLVGAYVGETVRGVGPAIGEPTHFDGMPHQLDVAGVAYHTFHQGFLGA